MASGVWPKIELTKNIFQSYEKIKFVVNLEIIEKKKNYRIFKSWNKGIGITHSELSFTQQKNETFTKNGTKFYIFKYYLFSLYIT